MTAQESMSKLADPVMLEKIDRLFEANIGEYVALPQLLVVGDQSSGKSSILEGLTGLPFPRDKVLCTRFATQITFRRVETQKVSVSIVPAADASSEHKRKLCAWKANDLPELSQTKFGEIIAEVQAVMGVSDPQAAEEDNKTTFSDDILKIEICGPQQEHFSVIDVPGIFRKKTHGVTTDADKEMVKRMVRSYMQNPRSVILAIVPANVDMATQEIIEMAEEYDKSGVRTLGVLTKPDLVDPGAEHAVVDIILGKSHPLKLGWYVVLNPGQKALDDEHAPKRLETEKTFFRLKQPWVTVPREQAGIEALRTRLVGILADMIEHEFPKVKMEISTRLKHAKQKLHDLGPSRETRDKQYKFVLDLATDFQRLANMALDAKYGGADIFDTRPNLRLATLIVDRNERFDTHVRDYGHKMKFDDKEPRPEFAEIQAAEEGGDSASDDTSTPASEDDLLTVRCAKDHWELEDILYDGYGIPYPVETGIKQWLKDIYKTSRGFELGTFDAALLPIIWKKQSTNWDALALGYISDIVCTVHDFITSLLSAICTDEKVEKGLKNVLLDNLMTKYKRGIDHTTFVLSVERSGTPMTTNHYFADTLEKCRLQRLKKLTEGRTYDIKNHGLMVRLDDLNLKSNASNVEHTIEDLHDILKSYYKVARKRFVDVICMQAADHYLVTGPDTPIKVFSPGFVNGITTAELERIAGEDASTKKKREDFEHDIEILENGRKILF